MARGWRKKSRREPGGAGRPLAWVGGRLSPPWWIEDREKPYQPQIAIWLELPTDLVVAQELVVPEDVEGAVGRTLFDALKCPAVGPPRSPDLIRVADDSLAAEVRAVVGDTVSVVVAPTPELDGVLQSLLEWMAEQRAGEGDAGQLDDEEGLEHGSLLEPGAPLLEHEALSPVPAPATPEERDRASKVRRNEPCPCGSGRKYKKCCLHQHEVGEASQRDRHALHELDWKLVGKLSDFAMARFDCMWEDLAEDLGEPEALLQLLVPWFVYEHRIEGVTVVDWYVEEHGRRLSGAERAWIDAQRAAWLSVWEVVDVERGAGLTLRDLLSGETRRVHEVSGSQTLVVRDAVLGRVVDHQDVSIVCGMHGRRLPPFEAAEVVRRARGRLRRKRAVPVERLQDESFSRYLMRRWEEAVAELDAARAIPPQLENTDGDPLLVTTDHFDIAPGARQAVEERLAALEHAEPTEPDADPPGFDILRPGNAVHTSLENTLIGRIRLSDAGLRIETNSRERADALRNQVEAACGDRIRHRAREHTDPLSKKASAGRGAPPAPPSPDLEEVVRQFKQRHYADWVDRPLPALGGLTPRAAARTAQGRAAVDVLLKDMENREQRWGGGATFDFSQLRRRLRIE